MHQSHAQAEAARAHLDARLASSSGDESRSEWSTVLLGEIAEVQVHSVYLLHYLNSPGALEWLMENSKSSVIRYVSTDVLRQLPVRLLPAMGAGLSKVTAASAAKSITSQ